MPIGLFHVVEELSIGMGVKAALIVLCGLACLLQGSQAAVVRVGWMVPFALTAPMDIRVADNVVGRNPLPPSPRLGLPSCRTVFAPQQLRT